METIMERNVDLLLAASQIRKAAATLMESKEEVKHKWVEVEGPLYKDTDEEVGEAAASNASPAKEEFRCERCHSVFKTFGALRTHRYIHTDKYKCYMCNERFTRWSLLRDHLEKHSNKKTHVCSHPDCGKAFPNKSNLRRHLKKIHNDA